MKFTVIGAGMSGLLAACMLREDCVEIIEKAQSLPNNHHAVLRFRSSVVGDVTNVPFKKVTAISSTVMSCNPIADALAYSKKTTGKYLFRSISSGLDQPKERYIAPPDLIERWHKTIQNQAATKLSWSYDIRQVGLNLILDKDRKIISTIPMPDLMRLTGWGEMPEFEHQEVMVIRALVNCCDVYATLYHPYHEYISRSTITGNELIIEIPLGSGRDEAGTDQVAQYVVDNSPQLIHEVVAQFCIDRADVRSVEIYRQKYGKILPIDDDVRKRFILYASEQFNIFSLGRFATWRPGLLMDDVVNDVRVIQKIAGKASSFYDHKK